MRILWNSPVASCVCMGVNRSLLQVLFEELTNGIYLLSFMCGETRIYPDSITRKDLGDVVE